MEASVGHAERFENARIGEFGEGFSRHPCDDFSEQMIARVAVEVFLTGIEIELLLVTDQVEHVLSGNQVPIAPSRHRQQVLEIAQTAGVMNQMANGNDSAKVGDLGNVI